MGDISAASTDQAKGISEISRALSQIDGVTQRNAASAEQTATAARELASNAAQVRQLLRQFRVNGLKDEREQDWSGHLPRAAAGWPAAPLER